MFGMFFVFDYLRGIIYIAGRWGLLQQLSEAKRHGLVAAELGVMGAHTSEILMQDVGFRRAQGCVGTYDIYIYMGAVQKPQKGF